MDTRTKIVFVVVGGVSVYLTYKYLDDHGYLVKWFPSMFAPPNATPAVTGGAPAAAPGSTPAPVLSLVSGSAATPAAVKTLAPVVVIHALPPAPAGRTPAQIAADTASIAQAKLYSDLTAAGVPGDVAADFVANQQSDAYLQTMYARMAAGDPGYMKLGDVGGVLFNADQWEFYRRAAGLPDVDPGLVFLDRTAPIHASEFNASLSNYSTTGGMSGYTARAWM